MKLKIKNIYAPIFVADSIKEKAVRREQQRLTWSF
jgi:hypothetical protein